MNFQVVLEALADPNRRRILEVLKGGELSVGEIAEHFEITGASLSHHLNKLKSADLVLAKRRGQNILYSIHTTVFEDVAQQAATFFSFGGKKNEARSKK
jgi:ArsR family transcriptional regulator, arsenate/arsenite/antimonite-responsive transcriptional repressor